MQPQDDVRMFMEEGVGVDYGVPCSVKDHIHCC